MYVTRDLYLTWKKCMIYRKVELLPCLVQTNKKCSFTVGTMTYIAYLLSQTVVTNTLKHTVPISNIKFYSKTVYNFSTNIIVT